MPGFLILEYINLFMIPILLFKLTFLVTLFYFQLHKYIPNNYLQALQGSKYQANVHLNVIMG